MTTAAGDQPVIRIPRLKAEYLWRPALLVPRLLRRSRVRREGETCVVPMLWGLSLTVSRMDTVTRGVDRLGVYDLVVTETLWRLLRPGDTAIDVGGNVGYMTLAMMARLRSGGTVVTFEPHPQLFRELSENVAAAANVYRGVTTSIRQVALSDANGTTAIGEPEGFAHNRGIASVVASGAGHAVAMSKLDDAGIAGRVTLMKIDVEGHEPQVLRGAGAMLREGRIDHVVFEEHGDYPSAASSILESFGYSVFAVDRSLFGPSLRPPERRKRSGWEAPSLLATRRAPDVERAFARAGWSCLARRAP
jgi:FkbM family methyltransferase